MGGVASVGFGGFWVRCFSGVVVGWPLRVASRSWWMVMEVLCFYGVGVIVRSIYLSL
jgi:hypothetical protein